MNTKPLMICIYAGGMPFNGETIPSGKSLGGSESAAYFMAKELVKIGHKVVVFTNMPNPGRWDGVIYDHCGKQNEQNPLGERFHYAMQVPWDVVVIQRHPLGFSRQINSKLNIWWLHDLALYRHAPMVETQLPFIDQIFTVSRFHSDQVSKIYGIDAEFITPTWNGVDYALFEQIRQNAPRRDLKSLAFASRPERGLEELVAPGGIMERLPDYTLHVCGYDNTTAEMAGYYQYLWGRCEELPNVRNYGPLGKTQLYDLLSRCGAYVYPTTFEDTSNIMLLEANAVGTPFIGTADHAALPETGKDGAYIGVPLKDGKIDGEAFAAAIRQICEDAPAHKKLSDRAYRKHQSWQSAARQWNAKIYELLEEKCSNKYRLTKHLECMSDVEAIMQLHKNNIPEIKKILPDFENNYQFYLKNDFQRHYQEYYQYEKTRGIDYGPESLHGNARFEHTVNVIKEIKPRTVLDYGCAHGHYVMNLLQIMPDLRITGMDIEQTNIDKALAWANKENPQIMPDFICGTVDNIPQGARYDCIVAAEVLEHVKDPVGLVEKLRGHLTENGYMVITTPYGPWEWMGYRQHKGWRAHIHHFERWDLHDLFGKQPEFKVLAIPHQYQRGYFLGHHLCYFKAGGPAFGQVDYSRKLRTQSPRETVSLCMIAKNEELSIGKALAKAEAIVDEIIIAIDETTTDETAIVANKYGAKTISIPSALKTGFALARNRSIEQAACDWVLWLDADESIERIENFAKYLRRSPVMGFGIPQHHFSEEPAGILKTDFPCRLFRNHRKVQFFGLVHEHPETKINEGVGKVRLIDDFGIMHTGYSTEAIRRERFRRNWPLMVRDNKENPNRILGQFLWMRDLAHMCKYAIETMGTAAQNEVLLNAGAAIEMWDKVLASKNIRMIADGLQYYSEAVHHLTNGNGIDYVFETKARRGNISATLPTMKGYFLDTKSINKFVKVITEEATKIYDERYF